MYTHGNSRSEKYIVASRCSMSEKLCKLCDLLDQSEIVGDYLNTGRSTVLFPLSTRRTSTFKINSALIICRATSKMHLPGGPGIEKNQKETIQHVSPERKQKQKKPNPKRPSAAANSRLPPQPTSPPSKPAPKQSSKVKNSTANENSWPLSSPVETRAKVLGSTVRHVI